MSNINDIQYSDEYWMNKAIELAMIAERHGEVPVGAIVVFENKIIGRGWNCSITEHNPIAHAEIIALQEAGQYLKNYRLINTTLYVTLEPCFMCAGAVIHGRVKRVVYGASDFKTGAAGSFINLLNHSHVNHQTLVEKGVLAEQCARLLSDFFKKRRSEIKQKKQQH